MCVHGASISDDSWGKRCPLSLNDTEGVFRVYEDMDLWLPDTYQNQVCVFEPLGFYLVVTKTSATTDCLNCTITSWLPAYFPPGHNGMCVTFHLQPFFSPLSPFLFADLHALWEMLHFQLGIGWGPFVDDVERWHRKRPGDHAGYSAG